MPLEDGDEEKCAGSSSGTDSSSRSCYEKGRERGGIDLLVVRAVQVALRGFPVRRASLASIPPSRDALAMRHGHHTRRSAPDPLAPIDAPSWLVVRDMCGQLLERTELAPGAVQRAVLAAAREARIADGWLANEVGPRCSHFFAVRAGERVMMGIERDPGRQIRR